MATEGIMIDPIGWLTAIAAAAGLLAGGYVSDWGFQAGAEITEDGLRLGITPVVVIHSNLLPAFGFTGMTLGGTVLLADFRPAYRSVEAWHPKAREEALQILDSAVRELKQYELGHLEGWQSFGIQYPIAIAKDPCRWDPQGYFACQSRQRTLDGKVYRQKHWAITLEVKHARD